MEIKTHTHVFKEETPLKQSLGPSVPELYVLQSICGVLWVSGSSELVGSKAGFLSLFSLWIPVTWILVFLMLSHKSLKLSLLFFILFSFDPLTGSFPMSYPPGYWFCLFCGWVWFWNSVEFFWSGIVFLYSGISGFFISIFFCCCLFIKQAAFLDRGRSLNWKQT